MRYVAVLLAGALASPALAQQAGTVTFGVAPASPDFGAPAGFRLHRDTTLVGPVTSGQTFPTLFPANVGAWTFAVEAWNAACGSTPLPACPRVTPVVSPTRLGPPPLLPPAPVINVTIDAPCARLSPPTCTITVSQP